MNVRFALGALTPALFCVLALAGAPLDTDGDGAADYAFVGDWDGDGTFEMLDDVQAAIDALTDDGDKLVELAAGEFLPPVAATGPGMLSLPDRITLAGAGRTATILHGFAGNDPLPIEPVVTNADHVGGNTEITIRDLQIDGGWTSTGYTEGANWRMGVMFNRCHDCRVERVTVRDTLHSCLYAKNSSDVVFHDNELYACGNYLGTGARYSCVYLFADAWRTLERVWVTDNLCEGASHSGLNTRRNSSGDTLRELHFSGNSVRHTRSVDGDVGPCISLRGVVASDVTDNLCIETGPLAIAEASAYHDAGAVDASSGLTVDGLQVNTPDRQAGVRVGSYLSDSVLRNINVTTTGPDADCLNVQQPLRNVVFEDITLTDCGRRGIAELDLHDAPLAPDEGPTFRRITIDRVDALAPLALPRWSAVKFRSPLRGVLFEDLTIDHASASGVELLGRIEEMTLRGITIRDVGADGLALRGGSSASLVENLLVVGAGDDGLSLDAFPGGIDHAGLAVRDSELRDVGGHGIGTAGNALEFAGAALTGNLIDGVDRTGILLLLDPAWAGQSIDVSHNTVRNFGRVEAGYGIRIEGASDSATMLDNVVEDTTGGALGGVVHDVTPAPADSSFLCSNRCLGGLPATACITSASDPEFAFDEDGDDVVDACDNCARTANTGQADTDADGLGDGCDNCDSVANATQDDADRDARGDLCDNCASVANSAQSDRDLDGDGDACDLDDGTIYLRWESAERLDWQNEAGFATWNVYRGDLTLLAAQRAYTQAPGESGLGARFCEQAGLSLVDGLDVSVGAVAFYLVSGSTLAGEGSLGQDSDGRERRNTLGCR